MRILCLGVAAVALSGCSWLGGFGHQPTGQVSPQGYYAQSANHCCDGANSLSRWNVEAAVGPQFMVGGDAVTGEDIHPGLGAEGSNISMSDAYDTGVRYELGGSYALNPNRKFTVTGHYAEAEGEDVTVGTIGGNAVTGTMGDYTSYGVEAGLRQYFRPTPAPIFGSVRPYVEGRVGGAYVDDIALENAQITGSGPWLGGNVAMYEGGWVPTGAGLVGIEAPVFKRATLGLETGIRYTGTMESDNSALNGNVPLAGINNGSDNWTVPVMLRGRFRF